MYKKCQAIIEIWIFIKRHIVICFLCLVSGLTIAKYSNIPVPEWFPYSIQIMFIRPIEGTNAFEWWAILNNLSLAFIGSIITYILIQYIPERIKAYKAFLLLKNEFINLYSGMSHLIDMYLFEINVKEPETKIKLKQLSEICEIIISNEIRSCKIIDLKNGKRVNVVAYGYALFKDSKKYAEYVQKALEHIKESTFAAYLDHEIIEVLSLIENNRFLNHFSNSFNTPQAKTPGYKSIILEFDNGFWEFIKCHVNLEKYHFDKLSYEYISISNEEFELEKENTLFINNRVVFKHLGKERVKSVADRITALNPTEERLQKSEGVLLEILVCYDSEQKKDYEILQESLKISEYIRKNEDDNEKRLYALLNTMQIKKRLHILTNDDIDILQNIISNKKMSNEVIIGASILCGEFEIATIAFEKLSEEKKNLFVQLPIYRLWINPPIEANLDPVSFIIH